MKKTTFFAALLFFAVVATVFAQEEDPFADYLYKIKLGVTAAPNMMFFSSKSQFKRGRTPTVGYSAGVSFENRFNEKTSLLINLNYQKTFFKGEQNNSYSQIQIGTLSIENGKTVLSLEYVSIPIVVRSYVDVNRELFLDTGLYLGSFLKASESYESQGSHSYYLVTSYNQAFANIDAGLALGLGYNFEISPVHNLAVAVRDHLGLLNIEHHGFGSSPTHANVVMLQLNYTANFHKIRMEKRK